MSGAFIAGVGLWAPGLPGWETGRLVLTGSRDLVAEPMQLPTPLLLAPNERRRAGMVVRLALAVAQEAAAMAAVRPALLRTVFGSANGDGVLMHAILESLAAARDVSPTQFHNSVHNAAAGYWSIGNGSPSAATCVGCHDATVPAALLKAVAEVRAERSPVLLCLYDAPAPRPLADAIKVEEMFGAALVLLPEVSPTALARLDVAWAPEASAPACRPTLAGVSALYDSNPAARILPLLEALARRETRLLALDLLDGQVAISVTPCSTDAASPR